MKNLKVYTIKKNMKLFGILSALTITSLVGCAKKNNNIQTTTENITTTEVTTEMTTEMTTENTTELTTEQITEYIEPSDDEIITSEYIEPISEEITTEEESKDNKVLNFFSEQYKDLQESINSIDTEAIKTKGKALTVTFIDFIFYDGEIYGITYDELSEGVKEQIYQDFCDIDALIENYVPGYKEAIGEKYQVVVDFISPKYYYVVDKIKEFIGEDNLEKLNEIKENAGDVVSDLYNKEKEKIKEKYENWRDN